LVVGHLVTMKDAQRCYPEGLRRNELQRVEKALQKALQKVHEVVALWDLQKALQTVHAVVALRDLQEALQKALQKVQGLQYLVQHVILWG
jgi:hypothetical protein